MSTMSEVRAMVAAGTQQPKRHVSTSVDVGVHGCLCTVDAWDENNTLLMRLTVWKPTKKTAEVHLHDLVTRMFQMQRGA